MDSFANIIMNIFPNQILRSLRGHVRGARDPRGNNESNEDLPQEYQDVFGESSTASEPRGSNESDDDLPQEYQDVFAQSNTPNDPPKTEEPGTEDFGDEFDRCFSPEHIDIYIVRAMLSKAKNLPTDVVDMIFDHAEYWVHSSNEIDYLVEHQEPLRVSGRSPSENKFALRSYPVGLTGSHHKKDLSEELSWDTVEARPRPLKKEQEPEYFTNLARYPTPKLVHPVRKIVFSIRSRDQGHGGEHGTRGTYRSSWTWFEAGLERFEADQECDPQCTYDVRYKSSTSKPSPLPVCGLRPIYPLIEPDEAHEGAFKYSHPLHHNSKQEIVRNKTATRAISDREVTWRWTDNLSCDSAEAIRLDEEEGRGRETMDGEFVRGLKFGDVVTVWAKARFPAWVNQVERVKIDIYWAV